jgi:Ca2+-binding RTX toxin-like protein
VQTILAMTAKHVGSAIGAARSGYEADTWAFNAATNWNGGGMHYSNDYGFGLVDAFAAVEVAKTWSVVMPTQTSANELASSATLTGTWNIGAARTNVLSFTLSQHINVEAMSLTFPTLSFAKADHLTVTLTSPNGTSSTLLYNNGGSGAYISGGWELMSREFLGQDAYGTWKVTITDSTASDVGTLKSAKLTAYGGSAAAANSVFVYTDEFAQYWTAARGTLSYTAGYASIDAAATTGAMTMNLLTRQGTIDGQSLSISVNTNVTKVIAGDGVANITGNNLGDTIISGLSNDVLVGGTGSDTLDGGAGTNTLTTGAGADKVKLHRGGLDYLTDFAPGMDKLVLSAAEFAALAGGVTASKFKTGAASTTRVSGGGLVFDSATSTLYADSGNLATPLQALATFTNRTSVSTSDFLVA